MKKKVYTFFLPGYLKAQVHLYGKLSMNILHPPCKLLDNRRCVWPCFVSIDIQPVDPCVFCLRMDVLELVLSVQSSYLLFSHGVCKP